MILNIYFKTNLNLLIDGQYDDLELNNSNL